MSSPAPPPPGDPADRIPLSYTQEFLCGFDKGDAGGPFGPRYHATCGWRLLGEIDLDALRQALADVVARHETLRTTLVRGTGEPWQEVSPPSAPQLVVRDLSGTDPGARDQHAERFLIEIEEGTLDVRQLPLLRAYLGRFDDNDAIFAVLAHHAAIDGWSMRLIMRDLVACYAARTTGGGADLPDLPQYRDYAVWQKQHATGPGLDRSRAYWAAKLRDARMLPVRMDRPRSTELEKVTSTYRFAVDPQLSSATLRFATVTRSSTFMILLAAYNVLLHRLTGATDIVVPTISSGRDESQFENTVGPFFNFIPLRTDLAGCRTLQDVVLRTRTTCIEAQTHDIPFIHIFGEAPELMAPFEADDLAVGAIQVFQNPFRSAGEMGGKLKYTEVFRRLLSQPVSSSIPDGTLWTLNVDPSEGIFGSIKFNRNEFDEDTISGMVDQFREVLRRLVTAAASSPLR